MITSFSQSRTGNTTIVTVASSLSGVVYFHWYLDGQYLGRTLTPTRTIVIGSLDQGRVDVLDTNDVAFDPIANAPPGFPAWRTLTFVRSLAANVARYRIEQQRASGAWTAVGYVQADPTRWSYEFDMDRLDDLISYGWRVIPIDAAGNDGTALTLAAELIVRTPDAPRFVPSFGSATTKVTFAAA